MKSLFDVCVSCQLSFIGVGLLGAMLVGCGGEGGSGSSSSSSGSSSTSSSSSSSSTSSSNSSSSSSSTGQPVSSYNHCTDGGFRPHVTNGSITTAPHRHERNGEVDLSVDPVVYTYMYENGWQDAHVLWHQARRCNSFGGALGINGLPSACDFTELLPEEPDCGGDQYGREFLAAHSLMMYQLRELWPDHLEQFSGWETFPRTAEDYPEEIRDRFSPWSSEMLRLAEIADNIEENLDLFPNEGALGSWINCAIIPDVSERVNFDPDANLHFGLHAQAAPTHNTKHSVNNTNINIDSYMFWKLHSWIDHVWMNYREAKGLTNGDPQFLALMTDQCLEMDAWREIAIEARGEDGHPNMDEGVYVPVQEIGFFHDTVRPALESAGCTSCHGDGPKAGMQLGGEISSAEIVERLVNRDSRHAPDYRLVVPGEPEQSWLYLKASGLSTSLDVECAVAGCTSEMSGLDSEGLENLREWIANGAHAPVPL